MFCLLESRKTALSLFILLSLVNVNSAGHNSGKCLSYKISHIEIRAVEVNRRKVRLAGPVVVQQKGWQS